ncbi:TraR/DksA C4-type zinc finger protein [Candidatus Amesbacteria bacterium]|nr:TraR/DksA C4-type zinc finger protein [Candidatus Amesbacteria bacterium]
MAKGNKKGIRYPWEVLEPVRKYLAERLTILEKRKKEVVEADPFKDEMRLDDNAAMDTDAAEQVGHMQSSAFRQALDRSIIQVRKALSRIRIGKYGGCEKCGKMIDTDRLMVMPEATLCVECEKRREK